jgi:hypothetical protein
MNDGNILECTAECLCNVQALCRIDKFQIQTVHHATLNNSKIRHVGVQYENKEHKLDWCDIHYWQLLSTNQLKKN